jgi:predicted porin
MKKNIIALAIASAVAAPVAFADAPTVYGQVNVAIDSLDNNGMKTTDRDSRLGIKGSEDLGNGLKAVYKMEFGIKVADEFKISGRNAYVGLAGGFGTVLVGRHDTPLKMSQAKDLFGDNTYADMGKKNMANGLGYIGKAGEVRADNVVAYVSPSFAGVKIVAAGISAESAALPTADDSTLANAYSVAAMYGSTKSGLYLAAAYNSFADSIVALEMKETRLSAQYKTGGLIGNVTYQTFEDGDSTDRANEGTNIQAQIGYTMGKLTPKVKYSTVDSAISTTKDASAFAVGLNYALGKKTTGYVEYVSSDKNMTAATGYAAGEETTAISVGLVHKF